MTGSVEPAGDPRREVPRCSAIKFSARRFAFCSSRERVGSLSLSLSLSVCLSLSVSIYLSRFLSRRGNAFPQEGAAPPLDSREAEPRRETETTAK